MKSLKKSLMKFISRKLTSSAVYRPPNRRRRCARMYVRIHASTHTHIHAYTRMYIHVYRYTYLYVYMYKGIHKLELLILFFLNYGIINSNINIYIQVQVSYSCSRVVTSYSSLFCCCSSLLIVRVLREHYDGCRQNPPFYTPT